MDVMLTFADGGECVVGVEEHDTVGDLIATAARIAGRREWEVSLKLGDEELDDRDLLLADAGVTADGRVGVVEGLPSKMVQRCKEFVDRGLQPGHRSFIRFVAMGIEGVSRTAEVVLHIARTDPSVLLHAHTTLREDRGFVVQAVQVNGMCLRYAVGRYRGDREVVLHAVAANGLALGFAADPLRDDRDVVCTAVTRSGQALQYASDRLRGDKQVALAALHADPDAMSWVAPHLLHDPDLQAINRGEATSHSSDDG